MSYTWVWWHRSYNGKISNSSQVFSGSPCSVVVFQCWCVRSVVDPLLSTHRQFDSPSRFDLGLWIFHLLYFCTCVDHAGLFLSFSLHSVVIRTCQFFPSVIVNESAALLSHSLTLLLIRISRSPQLFLPQNKVNLFCVFVVENISTCSTGNSTREHVAVLGPNSPSVCCLICSSEWTCPSGSSFLLALAPSVQ